MAYNIKVNEACRYSITSEQLIGVDRIPESFRSVHDEKEGSKMVYYEIQISSTTFKPDVDFTKWDPIVVKEKLRSYNTSKNMTSEKNTTTTNTDTNTSNVVSKRMPLSRKQTLANKRNKKKNKKLKLCIRSHAMRFRSYFSLESGIMVLDKKLYCLLANQFYDGIYYVLLMTHPLNGKKTYTTISYTIDPIHEIFLHNNLLTNDRSTSAAAPFWGADAILGPFASLARTIKCSEGIVDNTRGDVSKRNKCIELHGKYDVNLYLSTINDPSISYSEYVHNNTPPSYIQAYQDRYVVKKKKKTSH